MTHENHRSAHSQNNWQSSRNRQRRRNSWGTIAAHKSAQNNNPWSSNLRHRYGKNGTTLAKAVGVLLMALVLCVPLGACATTQSSHSESITENKAAQKHSEQRKGDNNSESNEKSGGKNSAENLPEKETLPNGGIWFNVEPEDKLGKYVYASQYYANKPLKLPPINDPAVNPAFQGKPNICAPEVFERLKTIGIKSIKNPMIITDYVYVCRFTEDKQVPKFALSPFIITSDVDKIATKKYTDNEIEIDNGIFGFECVSIKEKHDSGSILIDFINRDKRISIEEHCEKARLTKQLFTNILGETR